MKSILQNLYRPIQLIAVLFLALTAVTVNAQGDGENTYQLGNGDKIKVTVFGESELSGTFVVDRSGSIAMPLVGEVRVGGQDLRAAEELVVTELQKGFLKQPRVNIEVLNFRPFYILGEVKEPGSYAYVDGMSIIEAVAVAGGFTYRAKKQQVSVTRVADRSKKESKLSIDAKVLPGDVIKVEERFF